MLGNTQKGLFNIMWYIIYKAVWMFAGGLSTWIAVTTITYGAMKHFHAYHYLNDTWLSVVSTLTGYFIVDALWSKPD